MPIVAGMRVALLFILGLLAGNLPAAEYSGLCLACGQTVRGRAYFYISPYSKENLPVCPDCAESTLHCDICLMPLRTNYTALNDGRVLCQADYPKAVLSQDEARRIFEEVKRNLARLFEGEGVRPESNLRVYMVDRPEMERLVRTHLSPQKITMALGLTRSKHRRAGEFQHDIYLLSGQRRSRVQAVSAHEYTHAWLNQNLEERRQLHKDTVEAFCDLVAHNLMTELGDSFEPQRIRDFSYPNDQIKAMLAAQEKHSFYYVLKWMKSGREEKLAPDKLDGVLALQESPVQWSWLPQVQPTAPDRLIVKSISGRPGRQFVLVNNQTLASGELAKVRVGKTNVAVRCLSVTERSVMVQVGGTNVELFLETHGK